MSARDRRRDRPDACARLLHAYTFGQAGIQPDKKDGTIEYRIDIEGQADALTRSVAVSGRTPDTGTLTVETCCEQLRRLVDEALDDEDA